MPLSGKRANPCLSPVSPHGSICYALKISICKFDPKWYNAEASTLPLNPGNQVQGESKDLLLSPTMSLAKVDAKKLILFSFFTILKICLSSQAV